MIKAGLAFALRFPLPTPSPNKLPVEKEISMSFRQVIYQIHTGRSLYETNEKEKTQGIPYTDLVHP